MPYIICECGFKFENCTGYNFIEVKKHFVSDADHIDYMDSIDKKADNARITIKHDEVKVLNSMRLFGSRIFNEVKK